MKNSNNRFTPPTMITYDEAIAISQNYCADTLDWMHDLLHEYSKCRKKKAGIMTTYEICSAMVAAYTAGRMQAIREFRSKDNRKTTDSF